MKTICKTEGVTTSFIVTELEPAYQEVLKDFFYLPALEGFAKHFPADTPHLAQIYHNFEKYAEEMILQSAGARSVPWEKSLSTLLQLFWGQKINWWLAALFWLSVA